MLTKPRFEIYCRECDETSTVVPFNGAFQCLECGTSYDDEDGVVDLEEAEYYRQLYEGEKRAGLLNIDKCNEVGHEVSGTELFCMRCGMADAQLGVV